MKFCPGFVVSIFALVCAWSAIAAPTTSSLVEEECGDEMESPQPTLTMTFSSWTWSHHSKHRHHRTRTSSFAPAQTGSSASSNGTLTPSATPSVSFTQPTTSIEATTSPSAPSISSSHSTQSTPSTPPTTTFASPSATGTSGPTASQLAYLTPQNDLRATKGAAALTWNTTLEAYAQNWANNCQFKHSGGPYGENLAAGTGDFTPADGIKLWTNEESQFNTTDPVASHYTQVVWKGSKQLGCAVAVCEDLLGSGTGDANYYVCEYNPPGNVIGEFDENVEA